MNYTKKKKKLLQQKSLFSNEIVTNKKEVWNLDFRQPLGIWRCTSFLYFLLYIRIINLNLKILGYTWKYQQFSSRLYICSSRLQSHFYYVFFVPTYETYWISFSVCTWKNIKKKHTLYVRAYKAGWAKTVCKGRT